VHAERAGKRGLSLAQSARGFHAIRGHWLFLSPKSELQVRLGMGMCSISAGELESIRILRRCARRMLYLSSGMDERVANGLGVRKEG
jgi:hypothetical protein